jgi:hypothetical protein
LLLSNFISIHSDLPPDATHKVNQVPKMFFVESFTFAHGPERKWEAENKILFNLNALVELTSEGVAMAIHAAVTETQEAIIPNE